MKNEIIEMTQGQINRYVTIRNSLDGKITVADASSVLGISERQVIRLRNGVREEGAAFMKHKNTGTAPKVVGYAGHMFCISGTAVVGKYAVAFWRDLW